MGRKHRDYEEEAPEEDPVEEVEEEEAGDPLPDPNRRPPDNLPQEEAPRHSKKSRKPKDYVEEEEEEAEEEKPSKHHHRKHKTEPEEEEEEEEEEEPRHHHHGKSKPVYEAPPTKGVATRASTKGKKNFSKKYTNQLAVPRKDYSKEEEERQLTSATTHRTSLVTFNRRFSKYVERYQEQQQPQQPSGSELCTFQPTLITKSVIVQTAPFEERLYVDALSRKDRRQAKGKESFTFQPNVIHNPRYQPEPFQSRLAKSTDTFFATHTSEAYGDGYDESECTFAPAISDKSKTIVVKDKKTDEAYCDYLYRKAKETQEKKKKLVQEKKAKEEKETFKAHAMAPEKLDETFKRLQPKSTNNDSAVPAPAPTSSDPDGENPPATVNPTPASAAAEPEKKGKKISPDVWNHFIARNYSVKVESMKNTPKKGVERVDKDDIKEATFKPQIDEKSRKIAEKKKQKDEEIKAAEEEAKQQQQQQAADGADAAPAVTAAPDGKKTAIPPKAVGRTFYAPGQKPRPRQPKLDGLTNYVS